MDPWKTRNHSLKANEDPNKECPFIWYLKNICLISSTMSSQLINLFSMIHSCCNSKTTLIMSINLCLCVALERAVEELSSPVVVERPLLHLTLLQDYPQPLERYHDYEEDGFGELRAESTLSEKFCVSFFSSVLVYY